MITFETESDVDVNVVGGKARTLITLAASGFHTPPGVVVPIHMDPGDVALENVDKVLGTGPFAVRSSGASEDGSEQSLAGQYLSILEVEGESLATAVKRVRESAGPGEDPLPVLVQPMIRPVCAGVAFTADPLTGDRASIKVVAVDGLADRLVSGEVAGDNWDVRGRKANRVGGRSSKFTRRLARKVADLARQVEAHFGIPQDIEWAWDGNELWLIQARPITRLPDMRDWTSPVDGVFHRSLRFGEWIPEPVTPLFESWLLTRMERRLHEWINLQVGQVAPEPHHVVVNGWYFYSLNWLPAPGVALWKNMVSIVPRLPKTWRRAAAMFPQTARHAYGLFEDEWRNDLMPRYRAAVETAEASVDAASPDALVEMLDDLSDMAGLYFASMAVVAGSGYKMEAQLARFWNRHLKETTGQSHMVLLQGLEQADIDPGIGRLESLDWWRKSRRDTAPNLATRELAEKRERLEADARALLSGSRRKLAKFDELLVHAQHLMPVREEQVAQLGIAWPVMRRAIERLGTTFVRDGLITEVDDVFFLRRSEVIAMASGEHVEVSVRQRRSDWEGAKRLVAPLMVGRFPWIAQFLFSWSDRAVGARPSDTALVTGTPASPGRATGRVRVIKDSSQFGELEEGEIIVAPLTAPAWTELFGRAGGVVTDVGSALAHASIIAREFGIPAVVGCGDATTRLRDGQLVTVDGSTGNVEPADR